MTTSDWPGAQASRRRRITRRLTRHPSRLPPADLVSAPGAAGAGAQPSVATASEDDAAYTISHESLIADSAIDRHNPQDLGENSGVPTDEEGRETGDVAGSRQDTAESSEHAVEMPTVADADAAGTSTEVDVIDASASSLDEEVTNVDSPTPTTDGEQVSDAASAGDSARIAIAATSETEPNDASEASQSPAKIRWPDNLRRKPAASNGEGALEATPHTHNAAKPLSSKPPRAAWSSSTAAASPLPAAPPVPSTRSVLPPAPTGEGIVRASTRPLGRVSETPTRPRIPLTQDMALAAGRITSQDVTPYMPAELAATHPRIAYPPAAGYTGAEQEEPAVIVTRAQVISDRPSSGDAGAAVASRPSRRPRADSEDIETLDLDDSDAADEMLRLDDASGAPGASGASSASGEQPARPQADTGVRTARTPPPPPVPGATTKRTGLTGQHAAVGSANGPRPGPPPPPPGAAAKKQPTGQIPVKSRARKRSWWEVLFSDDYLRTLPRPSPAAITKQVSFMESSLGIKRGDSVLDVGCGLGQHALEFAKRGYLVVALDLALSMITRAAEEAQQRGLRINFLHKDIRDIGFEGTFDAIICVGTTFGFFDDEQNRGVITRLAHALKPGGRLLLEVANRDFVIASQPNLVWFEGDNCVVMEESDFNFYSSRLTVKRTMMRDDGRQSETEYNIRLYSVHELGQMLKQAGFSIKEVSGQEATRGMFFGAQSTRIIILAERRARRGKDSISAPPSNNQEG